MTRFRLPRTIAILGWRNVASGVLFMISGLAAMTGPVHAADTLARIAAEKAVRIGFANINPYGFVGADGKVTGEAPELAKAFFRDLGGIQIDAVVTDFGALIGGLLAGRFDVIATGMLIQPKRCQQVAFGNPEYQMGRAFAVKADNPLRIASFDDVAKNATARLGLLTGAGEIRYAEIAGIPRERRVLFPDLSTAIAGLQAGRVDAVVASTVTIRTALSKANDAQLQYVDLTAQPRDEAGRQILGYGGMAFRKEDVALREAWNQWLKKARESGELQRIIAPFGFGPETTPPSDMTAEKVCTEAG